MSDLDFYWNEILKLNQGERTGNNRGVVFHCGDYMLLESEQGTKETSCLDAARFLAGNYNFDEVENFAAQIIN